MKTIETRIDGNLTERDTYNAQGTALSPRLIYSQGGRAWRNSVRPRP